MHLDRTELTVGMLRKLGVAALGAEEAPTAPDGTTDLSTCTWRGFDDATNDALPLNCVSWKTALQICRARGGSLPTEAQ